MKLRLTIIGVAILSLLSCSDNDSSMNTLNGTWRVESFTDLTTGTVEHKTQENSWNMDITVKFDDTKNELSGTNISNTILADFNYVGSRQILVTNLMSTKVNQPKWADQFTVAILDTKATFQVNAEKLKIYYANKTKSVSLIRM